MSVLIRIYSAEQLPSGKLRVNALLPDGRVVDGEIEASLDQRSVARAAAQLPASRPLPNLTGQVELDDDDYRELRFTALLAEQEMRRNERVAAGEALSLPTPEAFAAAVTAPAAAPEEAKVKTSSTRSTPRGR